MIGMNDADYYTTNSIPGNTESGEYTCTIAPVHLEPPFIPFFRHRGKPEYVDDGKKHTLFSSLLASVRGVLPSPAIDMGELDYETIKPFEFSAIQIIARSYN